MLNKDETGGYDNLYLELHERHTNFGIEISSSLFAVLNDIVQERRDLSGMCNITPDLYIATIMHGMDEYAEMYMNWLDGQYGD